MDLAQILGTFGAPPLALMVSALLVERTRLLKLVEAKEQELKDADRENQTRLDQTADRLLQLAEKMANSKQP